MTLTDHFREVLRGGYITGPLDTQWKIVNRDGLRILYFQASSSRLDWVQNFFFPPVDGRPAGFQVAWQKNLIDLVMAVKENGGIDLCVGCSRGGPFAVYSAQHFGVPFITFGSPRPGRHCSTGKRVAGPRDIVTWLPPFYRQAGERVKIGKATRGKIPLWEWLSGHGPAEYQQRLEGL